MLSCSFQPAVLFFDDLCFVLCVLLFSSSFDQTPGTLAIWTQWSPHERHGYLPGLQHALDRQPAASLEAGRRFWSSLVGGSLRVDWDFGLLKLAPVEGDHDASCGTTGEETTPWKNGSQQSTAKTFGRSLTVGLAAPLLLGKGSSRRFSAPMKLFVQFVQKRGFEDL